jgi:hypothetical protein
MKTKKSIEWKKYFVNALKYFVKALICGFVAIIFAYSWEYFKFKREVQFERKIDLIIENRKQVADIYVEVDRLRRQINSNEVYLHKQAEIENNFKGCNPELYNDDIDQLKALTLRLNYIDELNKNIIDSDSINFQLENFKNKMKEYISCIEKNKFCEICTEKVPDLLIPLEKIIELHTEQIINLVK